MSKRLHCLQAFHVNLLLRLTHFDGEFFCKDGDGATCFVSEAVTCSYITFYDAEVLLHLDEAETPGGGEKLQEMRSSDRTGEYSYSEPGSLLR